MSTATFHIGDVFDVMASMPDGSVDLVLTSPPFLALRSYLPADHPDKAKEIGSEANPAEFVDTLLRLSAEWRRLLAPHGTLAVELGDTYSGSGGSGGDYSDGGMREGQPRFRQGYDRRDGRTTMQQEDYAAPLPVPNRGKDGWPLAKSLCLIPELYRVALVYGINPLTGQPSPAGQWRARNVVRWVRPNPPVGALGDKFRPATSDMVIACTSPKRWFDLDAVRTPYSENSHPRNAKGVEAKQRTAKTAPDGNRDTLADVNNNGAGAPPLDWWEIPPGGYQGSHYAVFPPELCVKPIKAMCPESVCRTCGEPRRRITEAEYVKTNTGKPHVTSQTWAQGSGLTHTKHAIGEDNGVSRVSKTLGFTDCGHGDYRPGRVLDPFGGSGTTGLVATGHGREAWLIDLDERNADLARERLGMFVDVVDTRTVNQ